MWTSHFPFRGPWKSSALCNMIIGNPLWTNKIMGTALMQIKMRKWQFNASKQKRSRPLERSRCLSRPFKLLWVLNSRRATIFEFGRYNTLWCLILILSGPKRLIDLTILLQNYFPGLFAVSQKIYTVPRN